MKEYLTKRQVIQYRLRVLKDAKQYGPTKTARRYGMNRDTIYAWRKELKPQKPGPKSVVSWQTDQETEELILQLKLATGYGPKRLRPELTLIGVAVGEKAIRGVLERAGLVEHHHHMRRKKSQKFYAPYPGYRVQIDTKVVPDDLPDLRSGERYQFTAIDIASKIRFLAIYDSLSNYNSIHFMKDVLEFFDEVGIAVECIQTDNHGTFTNLYLGGNKKADHEFLRVHPVTEYLLSRGIEHKLSRPATPQHNGFVERSHRTDGEEFYRLVDLSRLDAEKLQLEIKRWQFEYNYLRLHSSCGNQPPMKHYLETMHVS
jgi:hypothetical protein